MATDTHVFRRGSFFCVAVWVVSCATLASSLELDWIPAGDGPLPLSAVYRERLSRLCDVVDRGGPFPPSIQARLHDIQKLCAKLRRSQGSVGKFRVGFASVIGLGSGLWALNSYRSRGIVYKFVEEQRRAYTRPSSYKSHGSSMFTKTSQYARNNWLGGS